MNKANPFAHAHTRGKNERANPGEQKLGEPTPKTAARMQLRDTFHQDG